MPKTRISYYYEGLWFSEIEAKMLVQKLQEMGKQVELTDLRREVRG